MESMIRIIKQPHVTERSAELRATANQYVFRVAPRATKRDIKLAIEKMFKVKVEGVNTLRVAGKFRRIGNAPGSHRADWKKAIVRLQKGQEIKDIEETQ